MGKRNTKSTEWRQAHKSSQPFRTQRAIWLAALTSALISGVLMIGAVSPLTHHIEPTFHTLFIYASNLVLLIGVYLFCFRIIQRKAPQTKIIIANIAGTLTIAGIYAVGDYYLEQYLYGCTSNNFTITLTANLTAGLAAYLVSQLISNVSRVQQALTDNEHLQAENLRIRYNTLEQQISPHFLFNSLNTLDALIGTDDQGAHQYLQHLSETFRYNLKQQGAVTLAEELEFTHAYIYMMQIRYGDALQIQEHISPTLLKRQLPAISLQLLVENAIKHNIVSQRHPLSLSITSIETPTGDAAIRISNPRKPKTDDEQSAGIGLDNLSGRYNLLFNRQITISDDGNTFAVEIPLI